MPNKIITQVPVVLAHIEHIGIFPVDGDITLTTTYFIFDDLGNHIGNAKSLETVLTSGQKTTLINFITNNVLPSINTVEGT